MGGAGAQAASTSVISTSQPHAFGSVGKCKKKLTGSDDPLLATRDQNSSSLPDAASAQTLSAFGSAGLTLCNGSQAPSADRIRTGADGFGANFPAADMAGGVVVIVQPA